MLQQLLAAALAVTCNGPRDEGELAKLLWGPGSGYSKYVRPSVAAAKMNALLPPDVLPMDAPPETVWIQLQLTELTKVDTFLRTVEVVFYQRSFWFDPRLKFNDTTTGGCFHATNLSQGPVSFTDDLIYMNIWAPQLFVRNMEDQKWQMGVGSVHLQPDGRVFHSRRMSLRLSCDMDVRWYPYDKHSCVVAVGTYREAAKEVVLAALGGVPIRMTDAAVRAASTTGWEVGGAGAHHTSSEMTGSVNLESSLEVEFNIKRLSAGDLMRHILFLHLAVIAAYVSFFIDRAAAPARVTLTVVAFLTVTQVSAQ